MIFNTEDDGVIWTEENDNKREISIVVHQDKPNRLFYVAKDVYHQFRSAGIIESLIGITSLMYWVAGGVWDATGLIEG